jgi:hypothetical protein
MSRTRFGISGVAAETMPMTPTASADTARSRSAVRLRSIKAGYNLIVTTEPVRIPRPRWLVAVLGGVAILLLPWILYLTFTLPARHVTVHYDLAWVGFDIALTVAFFTTAWAMLRGSRWLVPFAAVTGTLLCCDAWFDVTTSRPGTELLEAIAMAAVAEVPLAALCAFIVYDAERFLAATITRYRRAAVSGGRASN